MNKNLASLVANTKRHTEKLVTQGMAWPDAKDGVLRIMDDLIRRHPECAHTLKAQFETWMSYQDHVSAGAVAEPALEADAPEDDTTPPKRC